MMPYEIKRMNGEFCVMKQDKSMGCHPTEEKAKRQMAALMAAEPMKAMMMAMPADEPAMRRHMEAEPPRGHGMDTADMPMAQMKAKHDAMHGSSAGHEHGAMPAKATLLDDDSFRLLAIPFGGPIPSPVSPKGVDLDAEWFSERTDIKATWLTERVVDWHHGGDALMGRTPIGKAVDPVMDDDGWWVTVWAKHGERRLELIKRLAEQQPIFGSSESITGMTRKASTGEILVWPYWRQTLSTSPQNTKSILRPLKASVDDLYANGVTPTAAFWADLTADLDNLQSDLRRTSFEGDDAAKAGRVLSAVNEAALRKSVEELFAVLAKLEKHPA